MKIIIRVYVRYDLNNIKYKLIQRKNKENTPLHRSLEKK